MKALAAAALVILQALAALAMLTVSVHAPAGLAVAAGLYFAAAAALTWWATRGKSWWLFGVVAVATLVAPPGIHGLLGYVERAAYEKRVAATQVSEVADEAILSAGKPVGVRVSFTVVAPERGYFGIMPTLYPRDERARGFTLHPLRWRFDGRDGPPEFGPLEAGRRHRVEFELYPSTLFITGKGERCLHNLPPPGRPAPAPGPLLVDVSETPYGAPWRGGREQPTRGNYDLAAMYRAVAEELPPCKVPGP